MYVYYVVYQTQPSPVISMPQVVDADYCYVRALVVLTCLKG